MQSSHGEVRVAVIGAGLAGRAHAYGFRNMEVMFYPPPARVRLVAVADANEALARDLEGRFGFERVTTSWESIAGAPDVDAVSIALPNYEHRAVAEACMAAGKHVLCEKPLGLNARECWALLAAARRAGVVHAVGFNYRRYPAIGAIAARARDGSFGELRQFSGQYFNDYALDPSQPYTWRYNKQLAGAGALLDIGPHLLDTARFLLGEVDSIAGSVLTTVITQRPVPASQVIGHERAALTGEYRAVDTDDNVVASMQFASGAIGDISLSRVGIGHKNAVTFKLLGSQAAASFDSERPAEFGFFDTRADDDMNGFRRVVAGPTNPYFREAVVMPLAGVGYAFNETFIIQAYEFVRAIAERAPLRSGGFEDGYAVALICDAIQLAAAEGRRIRIADLAREIEAGQP